MSRDARSRWAALALGAVSLGAVSLAAAAHGTAQHGPSLAEVRGYRALRWGMGCNEARAVLEGGGAQVARDAATGIFAGPARAWAEVTFETLRWRDGGREASAACEAYQLVSVALVERGLASARAAERRRDMLARTWGHPTRSEQTAYGRAFHWDGPHTRLSLFVTRNPVDGREWLTREEWSSRAPRRPW